MKRGKEKIVEHVQAMICKGLGDSNGAGTPWDPQLLAILLYFPQARWLEMGTWFLKG